MRAWIAGLAIAAGAAGGLAAPAMASVSQCPDQAVCFWNDQSYTGSFSWRQPGFGLWNISNANNDKLTSWKNASYVRSASYEHANAGGACLNMTPRTQVWNVGNWWNDKVSSWRTNGGCADF